MPLKFERSEALHDVLLSAGIVRLLADLLTLPVPSTNASGKRVQVGSLKVLELDAEDTTRVVLRYRDMLAEATVSAEHGRIDTGVPAYDDRASNAQNAWRHLKSVFSSGNNTEQNARGTPAAAVSPEFGLNSSLDSAPALLAHGTLLLRARIKSPLEAKHAERKLRDGVADHSGGLRGTVSAATLQRRGRLAEAVIKILWTSVRMGPSGMKVCLHVNLFRPQLKFR